MAGCANQSGKNVFVRKSSRVQIKLEDIWSRQSTTYQSPKFGAASGWQHAFSTSATSPNLFNAGMGEGHRIKQKIGNLEVRKQGTVFFQTLAFDMVDAVTYNTLHAQELPTGHTNQD